MANENSTTVIQDGQLAVATVEQTGTIVSGAGEIDTTALVETADGKQLCVKTVSLGGGGGGGGYTLPTATATRLGGVKVGQNLTVEADGTLNAQAGGGESLPSQTGHEGEFLTTDGTNASWGQIPTMLTSGLVPSTSSTVVNTNTPTAPSNGWYNITAKSTSSSCYMTSEITSTNPIYLVVSGYPSGMNMNLLVPATKGATYNFGSGSVTDRQIVFVPAEPHSISLIPSSASEQQTLQASGSAYEAPETGWFVFSGSSQGTSSVITCEVSTDNPIMQTAGNAPSGYAMAITVPVVKGREYVFSYSSVDTPKLVFVEGLPAKQNAIDPTSISGYDATKTQVLTNDTGDMKWAENEPVETLTTTSVELANNKIYNGSELASVTFTLPSTVPVNFTAQLNFTSGTTPTTFTAPAGVTFEGDACSNGTFTPVASKRYSVLIYSDGVNTLGLVMGN